MIIIYQGHVVSDVVLYDVVFNIILQTPILLCIWLSFDVHSCLCTGEDRNAFIDLRIHTLLCRICLKKRTLYNKIHIHGQPCGLTTLETRRLRGDQIEVSKILNGYENIDRNIFHDQGREKN